MKFKFHTIKKSRQPIWKPNISKLIGNNIIIEHHAHLSNSLVIVMFYLCTNYIILNKWLLILIFRKKNEIVDIYGHNS